MAAMAGGLSVMQLRQLLQSISLQFQGRLCGLTVTEFRPRGTPWTEVWMAGIGGRDVNICEHVLNKLVVTDHFGSMLGDTAKKLGNNPEVAPVGRVHQGPNPVLILTCFEQNLQSFVPARSRLSTAKRWSAASWALKAWTWPRRRGAWMRVARFTQSCHVPSKMVGSHVTQHLWFPTLIFCWLLFSGTMFKNTFNILYLSRFISGRSRVCWNHIAAAVIMIPGGQAPVSGRGPPLWSHGVWEQGPETVPRQAARIPGWRVDRCYHVGRQWMATFQLQGPKVP